MQTNISILVVDDEEVMRSLFNDILQEEGHRVITVSNGKEAVDKVKTEVFDIAFIDVHMPVMDGIKTLRYLREITPETTVVMMDSIPGYVLDEFKKEGAVTCIHKPFDIKEVKSVVAEIIKKKGN